MLPADPRVLFQVTAAVLGALVLWVMFVLVRLPTRSPVAVAKKNEPKPAEAPEKAPEADEKDEESPD